MIHLKQLGSTLKGETYPEPSYRSPHRISSMLEERTGILFGENNSNIFKKKSWKNVSHGVDVGEDASFDWEPDVVLGGGRALSY